MSSLSPGLPLRRESTSRVTGLVTVSIHADGRSSEGSHFVAELDHATVWRIRQEALTLRARDQQPVTIELLYVADPEAQALIATLDDLRRHDVHLIVRALDELGTSGNGRNEPPPSTEAEGAPPIGVAAAAMDPSSASTDTGEVRSTVARADAPVVPSIGARAEPRVGGMVAALGEATAAVATSRPRDGATARVTRPALTGSLQGGPDPFGLDAEFRASCVPPLQFLFERYWRIEVSGIEHVPSDGAALIAANHSGAIPVDAVMLSVALELRHPARRCLRVLYDKFVDALPFLGPLYNRLGGVSASLANAELLLQRGEIVGLFPEGISGVEKRWTQRYHLRPFKSGTARLSVRTGSPIVPVAIVGAEEAYPVVARLYRAGQLLGVPWIPVTPLFPHFGLVGALPFPSKWHIRFCPPIAPPPADGRTEEELISALTERLRSAITNALAQLLAKRRCIFV